MPVIIPLFTRDQKLALNTEWIRRLESNDFTQCYYAYYRDYGRLGGCHVCAMGVFWTIIADLKGIPYRRLNIMIMAEEPTPAVMLELLGGTDPYAMVRGWNDTSRFTFPIIAGLLRNKTGINA